MPSKTKKTCKKEIFCGNAEFEKDVKIKGSLSVKGGAKIKGGLTTDTLVVTGNETVGGDLIVSGNLIVSGQCKVTPLTLSDTVPTVISTPGKYRVVNSPNMQITGATTAKPNSCIIITSSDVHLDLCGQVLTGSGNKTAPLSPAPTVPGGIQNDTRVDASNGININPSGSPSSVLDNITIVNGKLQYYSYYGITASFVNNLVYDNLLIENCTSVVPGGAPTFFGNCSEVRVNNVHYANSRRVDFEISNTSRLCTNVVVTNCSSTGLRGGCLSAFFNPAWLALPDYVQYGLSAFSFQIIVVGAGALENLVIENCNISDVKSGAQAFGIYCQSGVNVPIIRACNINGVTQVLSDLTEFTGGGIAPAIEVRGIAVERGSGGPSINGLVEDCTVQNVAMNITRMPIFYPGSCVGYNLERGQAIVTKNCVARNISTAGRVTTLVPSPTILVDFPAIGFSLQCEPDTTGLINYQYIGCSVQTVGGGATTLPNGPSTAYGFCIYDTENSGIVLVSSYSGLYSNCTTQDVTGSSGSAGFTINQGVGIPPSKTTQGPIVYENCVTEQDRVHSPTALSNGFLTTNRGNNTIFRGCTVAGHTLNGFDLSGFSLDTATGNAKFILDNCIANGNSGYGFRLDHSLKQVEVINCKATNNGSDGINAAGRNLIFRNTISDLNLGQGFSFIPYYPFFAKVATDSSNVGMASLGVYGGAYTVTYTPGTVALPQFFQFFSIIPTNSSAPLPASLTINGVTVNNGDIVLIKDLIGSDPNTGGERNGIYQASNNGGVVVSGIIVPVWQLTRVDPWRAPYTVPAGTKVLVANSNAPNLTPGPVMYTLTNNVTVDTTVPVFTATLSVAPDPSTIIVDGCKAAVNTSNGFHNFAKDVTIRETVADRNGGIGFLDDSVGGARANANLYTRNRAFNNTGGNYSFDYSGNPGVLLTGTITGGFSIGTVAPDANTSITP